MGRAVILDIFILPQISLNFTQTYYWILNLGSYRVRKGVPFSQRLCDILCLISHPIFFCPGYTLSNIPSHFFSWIYYLFLRFCPVSFVVAQYTWQICSIYLFFTVVIVVRSWRVGPFRAHALLLSERLSWSVYLYTYKVGTLSLSLLWLGALTEVGSPMIIRVNNDYAILSCPDLEDIILLWLWISYQTT